MELEDIKINLGDDTFTMNPNHGSGGSSSSENILDQPVNTISSAVGESGARDGSGPSRNVPYQKKERQKTSKDWNDFGSVTIGGVKKS
jgi:hypothetical protein